MSEPGKSSEAQKDSSVNPFEEEPDPPCCLPAYSVNQITTFRASFEDDLAMRREAGIPGIGLWRQKLSDIDESAAVDAVRRSGLNVTTLSFAGGFTGSCGWTFREALEDGYAAVFSAAAFGARTLVISPGNRGWYTARHERRLVVEAIRELSIVAGEFGVELALLSRNRRFAGSWTSLKSLEEAIEMADETGRNNVGIVCDLFHLGRCELRKLEIAAPSVRVLQLNDKPAAPASEYDQELPGCGTLPLEDIVRCLWEHGFSGDIDLQVWSEERWRQDALDVLTECRAAVQSILRTSISGAVSPVTA